MVIGTSNGKQYEDMLHMHATPYFDTKDSGEQAPELDTLDQNVVSPSQVQQSKGLNNDPKNIYDDQGNLVDYDFWGSKPPETSGKNGPFDTPLPKDDRGFQDWKEKHAPNDSGMDYDLQGAYLGGAVPSENGHFPDTWKKPNHPTFSNESRYSTPDNPGGTWKGEQFIPPGKRSEGPATVQTVSDQSDSEKFNNLPDNAYITNIDKSPGFFLSEEMQQQPWKKYSDRAKALTKQTYDLYKKGDVETVEAVQDWESRTLGKGYNDTEEGKRLKKESLETYGSKTTMSKNALWEAYMKHLQDLAAADAEDEKHTPEMRENLENFSKFDRIGREQMDFKEHWKQGKFK